MLKNSLLLGFFFLLVAFSACQKKTVYDGEAQLAVDEARIKKWADSIGVTLLRDESGVHYEILIEGNGERPDLSDSLVVEYEGRLLGDSLTFSSADDLRPYGFVLQKSIEGWKIGLPLIKQGGRIRLLIPSPLGYKDYLVGNLPRNAVLDFTIDLKEIVKKK